ncbi:MAG TPA: hypothetical protein DCZ05_03910 [Deltaproteobacteria bacterium]|nr:MAG: hypothetical protein A2253_12795 [Deltaproteobacteria bacterium RIFOXYA2_FULL_55_11]HBA38899.1 hypothetical protein [Deltaproteobacteria bacterium]
MKIFTGNKDKPAQAVYVQMRQVVKGKDNKMRVTTTKTITIHDATIEQVRAILEKGERSS